MNEKAQITNRKIEKKLPHDSVLMLTLDIDYPQIHLTGSAFAEMLVNHAYRREARHFAAYARDDLFPNAVDDYEESIIKGFPFHPYEAVMRYDITLNRDCVVSATTDHYEFTGGAHGNTVRFSDSFDLRTGYRIRMRDLFPKVEDCRPIVLEQVLRQADERTQAEPGVFFDDYRTLIIKYFNPQSFFLTPRTLGVYYQEYEIAPYASGIVVFEMPYEDLGIRRPGCGPRSGDNA